MAIEIELVVVACGVEGPGGADWALLTQCGSFSKLSLLEPSFITQKPLSHPSTVPRVLQTLCTPSLTPPLPFSFILHSPLRG